MGDPIIERARVALAGACKRGYIQMCVPVQADDDDILISAALDQAAALLARVERLEAALRRRHQCPDCGGFGYNRVHGNLVGDRCACQDVADAALAAAEPAG